MRISEIIEKIKGYFPAVTNPRTCDVVKCGDPEQECSGIVITCAATVNVIRQAIEKQANLIICHEPLFYNHPDETGWLKGNPVFEKKRELLEKGHIVVWRCHDHIHGGPPTPDNQSRDMIYYGLMKELGWESLKTHWKRS